MNTRKRNHRRLPLILVAAVLLLAAGVATAGEAPARGWLGVKMQSMNDALDKALDLDEGSGVLVVEVVDDSPAARAGIESGDVILKIGGEPTPEPDVLAKLVAAAEPGDKMEIEYVRDGKTRETDVEIGEREIRMKRKIIIHGDGDDEKILQWYGDDEEIELDLKDLDEKALMFRHQGGKRAYLGVELGDLTEQLGDYFDVDDGEGALIRAVADDTPAHKAGLEAGDVIVAMDGEDIADAAGVTGFVWKHEPGDEVEIGIVRKGRNKKITAVLDETEIGMSEFQKFHQGSMPRMKHLERPPRIKAPRTERFHRYDIKNDDMEELREQMDELRQELQQMKKELKK